MASVQASLINITPITVEQTILLRHKVLWPEKPIDYVRLPEDDLGYHFGALLGDQEHPAAIISLFKESIPFDGPTSSQDPDTAKATPQAARFRKFACDPVHQGQGIGTTLLKHVFKVASAELGRDVVWCDARLSTAEWYERRGMEKFGAHFWKGDVEYVRMKIQVQTANDDSSTRMAETK